MKDPAINDITFIKDIDNINENVLIKNCHEILDYLEEEELQEICF